MNSWYSVEGKDSDVAIYTKISLQRNIKGFPFPNRMSSQQRSQVNELVIQALTADEDFNTNFQILDLDKLPQFSILALQERGLISPNFPHDPLNKKLILSNDEKVSIMLCGEDHIRATVLVSGIDFETAFNLTEGIDNIICSSLPIAFDDRLGFLTASPMDLGTALRAEVLMHLPSLETDGEIRSIADSVSRIGLSIKGITNGEGYNKSSLYRLSNLITIGITESAAIENLSSIAGQVISRERLARESLDIVSLEDSIFRAVALLKNARKISKDEFEELISKLKFGISLGVIKDISPQLPYILLIESGEGMLQSRLGEMHENDIDYVRADFLREKLKCINL